MLITGSLLECFRKFCTHGAFCPFQYAFSHECAEGQLLISSVSLIQHIGLRSTIGV